MSRFKGRQSTVGAVTVVCGMLYAVSVCRMGLSTDIPSPASINAPTGPSIRLNQTGIPAYQWRVQADEQRFNVVDETALTTPFSIDAGAPQSSLHLRVSSFGMRAEIGGQGGVLENTYHLQVAAPLTPVIRMAQTQSPFYKWEMQANDVSWSLKDGPGLTFPFVIEAGAPSNSLWIVPNGSVGLGTSAPNKVGNANAIGKFLNLRADGLTAATGVANGVFQGRLGGQNHFVHLGAAANQRVMRLQTSSGFTGFHVVNDSLASYAVPNVLSMKMSNGNVGLRVQNPAYPLHLVSGAHCTAGGVWTNASSRSVKQDIQPVTSEQARETVLALQPVTYRYKNEPDEQYVGFIAEDVPELVATSDRKSLAEIDITAVLTRVVQEQNRQLLDQSRQLVEVRQRNDKLERSAESLMRRVIDLEQPCHGQPPLAE